MGRFTVYGVDVDVGRVGTGVDVGRVGMGVGASQ